MKLELNIPVVCIAMPITSPHVYQVLSGRAGKKVLWMAPPFVDPRCTQLTGAISDGPEVPA